MKTTNKQLRAIDAEYAAALAEYHAARARLREVGAQRVAAHLDVEFAASAEAQRLLSLSDAEWEAKKQRVESLRGPRVEPVVSAPSAG